MITHHSNQNFADILSLSAAYLIGFTMGIELERMEEKYGKKKNSISAPRCKYFIEVILNGQILTTVALLASRFFVFISLLFLEISSSCVHVCR